MTAVPYPVSQCRDADCGADIIWAVTKAGKRTPVDADPTPDGTVLLQAPLNDQATTPRATVVDPDTPPIDGWGGTLHLSHFTNCPGAERWRSRKTTK